MHNKVGKKIGEGGCSEVFEWENEYKIIKLAKANTSVDDMNTELHNNRMAWENGVSVPQPFELVDIDGQPGIIFERIYGETLMERFVKKAMNHTISEKGMETTEVYGDIRATAQLLHQIHLKSIPNMPPQKESIKNKIHLGEYLTSAEKETVITQLERLPMKQRLCHGDPNPGNILLRDGKAVIIDWTNASIGNPEADLAEYIIMIRYAILPSYLPNEVTIIFDSIRESIITEFIEEYVRLSDITYDDIDPWIVPIAACRISADAICEDEKKLLVNEIRKRLKRNED